MMIISIRALRGRPDHTEASLIRMNCNQETGAAGSALPSQPASSARPLYEAQLLFWKGSAVSDDWLWGRSTIPFGSCIRRTACRQHVGHKLVMQFSWGKCSV